METETLRNADRWFALHDINTFIHKDKIYIDTEAFELELSEKEIEYRAELYVNLKNKNLLKQNTYEKL